MDYDQFYQILAEHDGAVNPNHKFVYDRDLRKLYDQLGGDEIKPDEAMKYTFAFTAGTNVGTIITTHLFG